MPSPRFKIKQSADGQFVVALYAANNECLCVTETYTTLQSAERAVDAIRNAAQRADIVYDPEKKKPTDPPPSVVNQDASESYSESMKQLTNTVQEVKDYIEEHSEEPLPAAQQFEPEQLPATATDSSVPSDSGTDPSGTTPSTPEQPPAPEPNPFSDLSQQ